ncbi:MAG: hypothetical protein ACOVO2_08760 [Emticicia sp.]
MIKTIKIGIILGFIVAFRFTSPFFMNDITIFENQ